MSSAAELHPTWILHGGKIRSLDGRDTVFEALAVRGGEILAVGPQAEMLELAGPGTQLVNLGERTVLPGLTDAHIHVSNFGRALRQVDCNTDSLDETLSRVAEKAATSPRGTWILGHGWDQNRWGRYGHRADLDRIAPSHPVYLTAKSLHAAWTNTAGLAAAGLHSDSHDPVGGRLDRDGEGELTGILFEAAMDMVAGAIGHEDLPTVIADLAAAQQHLWELGVTGVHDFDGPACLAGFQALRQAGGLGLRVVKHILVEYLDAAIAVGLRSGFGDDWIRIGHIKVFADGALGPRTASMLRPYQGEPNNLGVAMLDAEELTSIALRAAEAGFPMAVHAIGDAANHTVLDAFEAVRRHETERGLPAGRHRIEHLQLLHPDDVLRPAKLGLIASMQPVHALSDRAMADKYWGDRARLGYAWHSQLAAGATLLFGSDAPVESPNPFVGLYAATTRRGLTPQDRTAPWYLDEAVPLLEALRGYTTGPAYAAGLEGKSGQIRPGFLADLIVLKEDPFEISPDRLLEIRPVGTMVGGEWHVREF
jgi:predicted amidohydrolase YtcJ